eukprot:PhM_4_TR9343/c0_g1_i1/m.17386
MSEYLRELESMKEGDPHPPINLGPYDNPLLWNYLDPYGADRAHQRRPISVSRNTMELQNIPLYNRDHCIHRYMPFRQCARNIRPMVHGSAACFEFEESWMECMQTERYRTSLLKTKFLHLTKDYTKNEKTFFPNQDLTGFPYQPYNYFWAYAASARLSGWDENDPANPMTWREPNRARMRALFPATLYEKEMLSSTMGFRLLPSKVVDEELNYPVDPEYKPQPYNG